MNQQQLDRRIQTLDVGALLFFFDIDMTSYGLGVERLHCNRSDDVEEPALAFNGNTYTYAAIDVEGLKLSNNGEVNTPTLRIANRLNGIDGAISAAMSIANDFIGCRVDVHMTTHEALSSGSLAGFKQSWWVDRKLREDDSTVEFELNSPIDFKGQQVPTRVISDICTWAMRGEYRGESCGYTGSRMFDKDGNSVTDLALDDCGGLCNDCIKRFGDGVPLPFGGFLIPDWTNF